MEILQALKATASQSGNPNNDDGWGIPNMCAAHNFLNGTNIGISELMRSTNFKLFPSPAHQHLNIALNQIPESITFTDVLGKVMDVTFTENGINQYIISLNNIPQGVYFISVKTTQGLVNSKFIKE